MSNEEPTSHIDSIIKMFIDEVQINGGLRFSLADVSQSQAFNILNGRLIFCDRLPFLDRPTWCVDLTHFGGPAGTAVT